MAKKEKSALAPRPVNPLWSLLRPQFWLLLLIPVALFFVGRFTREQLADQDRYAVPFLEVQCDAPPGRTKAEFLSEVRYLSDLPDRLHVLDRHLSQRLAQAFGRHPWVEGVDRVEVLSGQRVQATVRFRKPALAVVWEEQTRVVDGEAVLLPASASAANVPVFRGKTATAPGLAGAPWADVALTEAAKTAAFLDKEKGRLAIVGCESDGESLTWITEKGTRILWGRPPGKEWTGEPTAAKKLERWLQLSQRAGGLEAGAEIDLRK